MHSVKHISEKIRSGEISSIDLVEFCLGNIEKLNPTLNAFISFDEDKAFKKAEVADSQIMQGKYLGPLHGIPFSVKDVFYVKGERCTAGSKVLANFVPDVDATAVRKMEEAGAILIGKNNLDEFAFGILGVNTFYGNSKNPFDNSKISGGSAVAVASNMVPISLATDTGGSIRSPSSLCGVVGLKPTYGRVSKYGIFPLAPSMDHAGCITKSVWMLPWF